MRGRLRPLALLLAGVWLGGVLATAAARASSSPRARFAPSTTSRDARRPSRAATSRPASTLPSLRRRGRPHDAAAQRVLERLHGAIEANRRFAADASHELRTPLTAIAGEVDVTLKRDRPAAEYRETLGLVRDHLRQMTELTENLMVLVRAQERAGERRVQEVPLAPPDRVGASTRAQGRRRRGASRSPAAGSPTPMLYGDARLYARVFDNLLANAVAVQPRRRVGCASRRSAWRPASATGRQTASSCASSTPGRHSPGGVGAHLRAVPPPRLVTTAADGRRRPRPVDLPRGRHALRRHDSRGRARLHDGTTFEIELPGRRETPAARRRPGPRAAGRRSGRRDRGAGGSRRMIGGTAPPARPAR